MIIENENIGVIAKDFVNNAVKQLVEKGTKFLSVLKDDYAVILQEMIKNLSGETKGIVYGEELEKLDVKSLVAISKKYIVTGCTEVVALKEVEKDCAIVYLTYSKDKELLPSTSNRYVIIKTKELCEDVVSLFADSELIILN